VRAAVVGGGIAGLSAAWELAGAGAEVAVYEPGHLGGKLLTSDFMGRPVDEGPDAFLARVPDGVALCEELGLAGDLVAPAATDALVWSVGKLRALPKGLVLGAPARLGPLARSGWLSPRGLLRAAIEPLIPPTPFGEDETAWEVVAARFGDEVADKLVEPLVGSIYAGTTRRLSAAATASQLLSAAKSRRSLLLGLRAAARRTAGDGPVFLAPKLGMQSLADRLVERLREKGTTFEPVEVTALSLDGRRALVEPTGEAYDGAVVATPAPVTAKLLGPLGVDAGDLARMQWASVAIVTLGLPEGALPVPAGMSGLLVRHSPASARSRGVGDPAGLGHGAGGAGAPASARSRGVGDPAGLGHGAGGAGAPASARSRGVGDPAGLVTACSFGHNKWPHWAGPGVAVLRVSLGRAGDEGWSASSDDELAELAVEEVSALLGRPAPTPLAWRVSRWPASLPQYPVGHLHRVAELRAALSRYAPRVVLAGASYGRVGVPACIASGRQAARSLLEVLGHGYLPGA
jgi:oxygen-dependent protoporphyrinogen oxidase